MSIMSDLNVDKAYGAPEMNKEYLDNIINGLALDDPAVIQDNLPDDRQDNLPDKNIQDVANDALMA